MKVKLREKVYIPTPIEQLHVWVVFFYIPIMEYVKHQIVYIHLASMVINYSVPLKNFLKYSIYENRV